MAAYRKLSRPSDQRQAMLRGLVTTLIWNGKVQTTEARAKEVRRIAERMITLAMKECDNNITVKKTTQDGKEIEVRNDAPSKLHARRQIMSYLYDVQPTKGEKESKSDYIERTREVRHPAVEKLFSEIAPKYNKRKEEKGQGGGYTRILKMGPRRGDAAETVVLELV